MAYFPGSASMTMVMLYRGLMLFMQDLFPCNGRNCAAEIFHFHSVKGIGISFPQDVPCPVDVGVEELPVIVLRIRKLAVLRTARLPAAIFPRYGAAG